MKHSLGVLITTLTECWCHEKGENEKGVHQFLIKPINRTYATPKTIVWHFH